MKIRMILSFFLALIVIFSVTIPVFAISGDSPAYAIIHYSRADDDYGDHTTGDYNDFWGVHFWGDITETVSWTDPKPFLGQDDYGRFAWVALEPGAEIVGFIIHRGNTKDGTMANRFFDPRVNPEIWIKNDDATTYTSQAEAQGYVTIHYHRPDGNYGNPVSDDFNDYWGIHLWGDAINPSEETVWTSPKKPSGTDDFGIFWNVQIIDPTEPVNFVIHRGDTKDPGPDQSFVPEDYATVWINSGDTEIHTQRGAVDGYAVLHYHRPAGDYGDHTSTNYNDYWGLHTWEDASSSGWTTPRKPDAFDTFGAIFKIDLFENAEQVSYILHRGDTKDPGPDQFLILASHGYEVWQIQGADPDIPYILPILTSTNNSIPVADANGPYTADPGSTITLDGTGSYDPDGEIISYLWDLDNDGVFDDSGDSQPSFTVGGTPGDVYPVCLKVVDDAGLYDIACTTVTVQTVPQPPPTEVGGEIYSTNKLVLLGPWITLGILVASWSFIIVRRRRTQS